MKAAVVQYVTIIEASVFLSLLHIYNYLKVVLTRGVMLTKKMNVNATEE